MAPTLISVSAICTVLLVCFLPIKRIYSDIPSFALVAWLLLANLVHLVNAVVWAGNVDVHSEIWCDITTKLVLGVNVAVPAAFLCIGRHLELLSSKRKIFDDPRVRRNSKLFDVLCCYIIPLIYMSLHVISQSRRYDLVQDLGCVASIHPSTPALVIIWALPLLLCVIALFLCGFALHHSLHMNTSTFMTHLQSRTTMPYGVLFRRLATAMIVTGIITVTTLFSLFSIPSIKKWTSWEDVHARLGEVNVLTLPQDIAAIQVNWWTLFVISVVYIFLSLVIGEETRDAYRWWVAQSGKSHQRLQTLKSKIKSKSFSIRRPRRELVLPMAQTKPARPYTVELKSGWDDMLEFKYPKSSASSKGSRSAPPSPVSSIRSPSVASERQESSTPSKAPVQMSSADAAFMNSTISYLGSSTAKTLGVSSTASERPLAFHLPRRPPPALAITTADPVLPPCDITALKSPSVTSPVVRAPSPQIASAFEVDWPLPPNTPSPVCSRYGARSPTESLAESTYSDVPSYYREGRPFEGAGVVVSSHPESAHHITRRPPSLKRSLQNLRVSWERVRHGPSSSISAPDGIRMTVVQETV